VTTSIIDAMAGVAECVCQALTERGAGEPCWCGPWHGETVAWDYCDACGEGEPSGMAWVRLVGTFTYQVFPVALVQGGCRLPLAYTLEIGAIRYMPQMASDGSLPEPNVVAEGALAALKDHDAILWALSCCKPDGIRGWEIALDSYQPLGPQGNCGGGAWTAHVTFDA
jgi:hypothetical protein